MDKYCDSNKRIVIYQVRVVLKVDNIIQYYPADSVVCFVNTYPLDDVIQPSNNRDQVYGVIYPSNNRDMLLSSRSDLSSSTTISSSKKKIYLHLSQQ